MNSKMAFGVGLLVGIVTGGGAGFYISNKLSEKSKEDEIASVREKFDSMQKELIEKNRKEKERMEGVFNEATEKTLEVYDDLVKEYGYASSEVDKPDSEQEVSNETKPYVPTPEEVAVHEFVQEVASATFDSNEEKEYDTYLISVEDTLNSNYETKSLRYFPANGRLMDERGIGLNALKVLGKEIIEMIPELAEQNQYIWARNDGAQKDYEIELIDE